MLGPQIARLSLGGPGAWAAIVVALGVGSIAGGVIALRARPRHPFRLSFVIFVVITPALFALVAAHAPLALILPVALIDGSSGTMFNTFWFTAVQSDVPAGELARVMSWDYFGSVAILPLGQALSGPVAAAVGPSTTLYGAAALTAMLFGARARRARGAQLQPAGGGAGGLERCSSQRWRLKLITCWMPLGRLV